MPLDLIVVRHAIAFERDPARWPDDRQRPLTDKGVKQFEAAARGVRRVVPTVGVVLTSPLVRARQTADILVAQSGWPAPHTLRVLEPDTPPAETVAALKAFASTNSIAVVGHEPHLSELTTYLMTGNGDPPVVEFRKGGVALLRFEEALNPGSGLLRWLLPPKVLRLLG